MLSILNPKSVIGSPPPGGRTNHRKEYIGRIQRKIRYLEPEIRNAQPWEPLGPKCSAVRNPLVQGVGSNLKRSALGTPLNPQR